MKEQAFSYDSNEQQTERDEYDYGSGTPGALTRITVHAYGCATGVHIVDRPTAVIIEDASRVRVAETDTAYDQSPLAASGATDGRDPNYAAGGGVTTRCNPTATTRYNITGNITETSTFDDSGNLMTHTDGNGNTTSYASSLQAAYLTQITRPTTLTGGKTVQHSTQMAYDQASGRLTSTTDVQNATTISYIYNDPLGRETEADFPDGGKTLLAYNAGSPGGSVETKRLLQGMTYTDHFDHWDGLGNQDRSLTYNGTTWDTRDTAFDGEQLPEYASYPYFSSGLSSTKATANGTEPGDTAGFDALGRETQVTRSDGAVATTAYNGTVETTTDEAGSKRDHIHDGLGRLIEVREYTDAKGDHNSTYYGYGLLDDLKSVSQGSETRTYDYDSLNRLQDASNPESGTVNYTYDNDGNLTQVADANGTAVTYTYDALSRLRARSYTVKGSTVATPSAQIDYDLDSTGATVYYGSGRMTRVIAGATSIGMDQYDAMGRLQTYDTSINGTNYHTSMRFDGIGDPVWEEFPDGRMLDVSQDVEGRQESLYDDATRYGFMTGRGFNPASGMTSENLGNGLTEAVSYNSRLQPTRITVKNPSDATNATWRMSLSVGYTQTGVQTADNGNVVSLVDNLGNNGQQYTMTYDALNRMQQWTSGSGTNCQFAIDQYGNLSLASGLNCGMLSGITFNGSNQITGYSYDASGNLLSDTSGSAYTWDGNNQMVAFTAPGANASYVYDGLLRRVEKTANSASTIYVRDALGNVGASLTGGVWTDYVFARAEAVGNRTAAAPAASAVRVAAVIGSGVGNLQFFHADQVGTTRAITDQNANNLVACNQNSTYANGSFLTYSPFGTPMGCTTSASDLLYTGKEQDFESSLDQFQYRKYSTLEARWIAPDPAGVNSAGAPSPAEFGLGDAEAAPSLAGTSDDQAAILSGLPGFGLPLGAVDPNNPQTWNPYAYVGNAPDGYIDSDGRVRVNWCAVGALASAGLKIGGILGGGPLLLVGGYYLGAAVYIACF